MSRRGVLLATLGLLALPAVIAAGEAFSFYARNRSTASLESGGEKREYVLHVPKTYNAAHPVPLVISMHAAALWPVAQMEVSQWNELADENNFIVAYPAGRSVAGPRIWQAMPGPGLAKDIRFISDLIDTLEATYAIDAHRIYADGLSNGGGMAFVLSCALPHRIAAVGLVASAQLMPWRWCADRHAVPMIAIHGTADPVVPYHGGRSWVSRIGFPDITMWTANWARRNQCDATPSDSVIAADVVRHAYHGCAEHADVVLYTIEGGGHSWPGGGPLPKWLVGTTSNSIDATRELWKFFSAHTN